MPWNGSVQFEKDLKFLFIDSFSLCNCYFFFFVYKVIKCNYRLQMTEFINPNMISCALLSCSFILQVASAMQKSPFFWLDMLK